MKPACRAGQFLQDGMHASGPGYNLPRLCAASLSFFSVSYQFFRNDRTINMPSWPAGTGRGISPRACMRQNDSGGLNSHSVAVIPGCKGTYSYGIFCLAGKPGQGVGGSRSRDTGGSLTKGSHLHDFCLLNGIYQHS